MSSNVTTLQNRTQNAFLTLNLITQACHGVLNTTFVQPQPKPSWYDSLSSKLDAAQANASNWINNLAPDITAGVPLAVINYGSTYAAFSQQIQDIANAHPGAMGANDPNVKQVAELISALQEQITGMVSNADDTAQKLKAWGEKMQQSHDALTSGASDIQSAETDLQSDVSKMNQAINTLHDIIAAENIALAASIGATFIGILLAVIGILLIPETLGVGATLCGAGGLLSLGGAVGWGIMQEKINNNFNEIAQDQKKLDSDKQQIVALQGLALASKQAVTYINTATSALSDFRTSWTVFEGELQGVADKLAQAESSLDVIVQEAFSDAATREWAIATSFAQQLSNLPVSVPKATMNMDGTIQQAA
ncbi:alpha-pore-forming cytotoxin MakA [Pectobacterium polaris]|uniref:alpha-pore-forming cytotoxin MakA n=1 Tax=Pectobacterium polaris TaxID=2042057 RepID=UPI001581C395|nr:HBL/NHE enterotoxin family protein [Pectobacterium polaris]MCU1796304.1 non-hemolytic enterotoxin lytic component L1 [Pectobacterium polaris]